MKNGVQVTMSTMHEDKCVMHGSWMKVWRRASPEQRAPRATSHAPRYRLPVPEVRSQRPACDPPNQAHPPPQAGTSAPPGYTGPGQPCAEVPLRQGRARPHALVSVSWLVSQSVSCHEYIGGGGGPSAISLLLLNLWCLRVGCCSRTSVLYSCGKLCCILCHVRAACSCRSVFSGGRLSCSCSDLEEMRSASLVLVMNLTALFCVRCSESMFVLATVWTGTAGYISVGRMIVVYSLCLFLVLRCLNLYSLFRFVLAIAFLMFTWLCIPVRVKLSPNIFPLFAYG